MNNINIKYILVLGKLNITTRSIGFVGVLKQLGWKLKQSVFSELI